MTGVSGDVDGASSGAVTPTEPEPGKSPGGRRSDRAVTGRFDLLSVLKVVLYAFFGLFLLLPLLSLIIVAFTEEPANILGSFVDADTRARNLEAIGNASLNTFIDALTSPTYAAALRNSLALARSEEHTSELQSRGHLVCRL